MTELRGPKFVTILVLIKQNDDKRKYDTFDSHSKEEKIINESGIDDVFHQSILQFYQTYKNL